jgi:hypothetical protein
MPGYGGPMGMPSPWAGPQVIVRHRPGLGLVVGLAGLLLAILSLTALPWISEGSDDATLSDIRGQFEGIDPPSEVAYVVAYARWVWIVLLVVAAISVLISTALVPSSKGARIAISCVVFAFFGILAIAIGVLVNLWDERGVVGPRINAAFLTTCAIAAHVGAHIDLFTGEGAPDPAFGVWVGHIGLIAVLIGCMIGTRAEPQPAPPPVPVGIA